MSLTRIYNWISISSWFFSLPLSPTSALAEPSLPIIIWISSLWQSKIPIWTQKPILKFYSASKFYKSKFSPCLCSENTLSADLFQELNNTKEFKPSILAKDPQHSSTGINKILPGGSVVKNPFATQEICVWSLGQEDSLEKEMATHSNSLAWEIPWTEKPGGLQFKGSQKSQTEFSY